MRNVVRGDLALLNRDVHNLMRTGAVARGVNVRRAGLHLRIDHNALLLCSHPRPFQVQPGGVRRSAECEQNFLRRHAKRFALMLKRHPFQSPVAPGIHQPGRGVNCQALAPKNFLQFRRRVRVKIAQDVFAALNDRYFGVKPREELGELDGHRPTAEHDQRLRGLSQLQGLVAGQVANFLELEQGRRGNNRARADNEMSGGKSFPAAQDHRVRIREPGRRADKSKFSARELMNPFVGKFFDQRVFARHDLCEIKSDLRRADAPGARVSGQMNDIRRVKQSFGRHAAAQDA